MFLPVSCSSPSRVHLRFKIPPFAIMMGSLLRWTMELLFLFSLLCRRFARCGKKNSRIFFFFSILRKASQITSEFQWRDSHPSTRKLNPETKLRVICLHFDSCCWRLLLFAPLKRWTFSILFYFFDSHEAGRCVFSVSPFISYRV